MMGSDEPALWTEMPRFLARRRPETRDEGEKERLELILEIWRESERFWRDRLDHAADECGRGLALEKAGRCRIGDG